MIEHTAVVLQIDGQYALVEAQRESSCGKCSAQKGCGTGMLAKSIGQKAMRLRVLNQCDAQPGDTVVVGMPEKGFLKSAFVTYMLPLLLILLGAIVGNQLAPGHGRGYQEGITMLGAALGFVVAMWVLKRYSQKLEQDLTVQPVVLRKSKPQFAVTVGQSEPSQQKF